MAAECDRDGCNRRRQYSIPTFAIVAVARMRSSERAAQVCFSLFLCEFCAPVELRRRRLGKIRRSLGHKLEVEARTRLKLTVRERRVRVRVRTRASANVNKIIYCTYQSGAPNNFRPLALAQTWAQIEILSACDSSQSYLMRRAKVRLSKGIVSERASELIYCARAD